MAYRPIIERARGLLPPLVAETVADHFLCGIDPRFVGLHSYQDEYVFHEKTWTYAQLAHACFSFNSADRVPRVVFPDLAGYRANPVATVVHEVGHLFDEATGFAIDPPETTEYSRTNRYERFAEAFEMILMPSSGEWELFMEAESFRPLRSAMDLA